MLCLIVILLVGDQNSDEGVAKWVLNDLGDLLQLWVLANLLHDLVLCDVHSLPFLHLVVTLDVVGSVDETLVHLVVLLVGLLQLRQLVVVQGEDAPGWTAPVILIILLFDLLHR